MNKHKASPIRASNPGEVSILVTTTPLLSAGYSDYFSSLLFSSVVRVQRFAARAGRIAPVSGMGLRCCATHRRPDLLNRNQRIIDLLLRIMEPGGAEMEKQQRGGGGGGGGGAKKNGNDETRLPGRGSRTIFRPRFSPVLAHLFLRLISIPRPAGPFIRVALKASAVKSRFTVNIRRAELGWGSDRAGSNSLFLRTENSARALAAATGVERGWFSGPVRLVLVHSAALTRFICISGYRTALHSR